MIEEWITIQFDGGCRPTNPGTKYGSYRVVLGDLEVLRESRFELGWGTNNEAEFESLERALRATLEKLEEAGLDPKRYGVLVVSDSTILVWRVRGKNSASRKKDKAGEASRRMALHAERCRVLLARFGFHQEEWRGREANVAQFGH